jgi:hypothetical protein
MLQNTRESQNAWMRKLQGMLQQARSPFNNNNHNNTMTTDSPQRRQKMTAAVVAMLFLTSSLCCWVVVSSSGNAAMAMPQTAVFSTSLENPINVQEEASIEMEVYYKYHHSTHDSEDKAVLISNRSSLSSLHSSPDPSLLSVVQHRVQQVAKSLVALEELSERALLKAFRLATHPVVLLDIAIILVANAMASGVLLVPARSYKGLRWIMGSTRRWLRVTGSARRWTRLLSFVVERRGGGGGGSTSRAIAQLARGLRNPLKSTMKIVGALWEHRSRYSLLSDYAWYVNTGGGKNATNELSSSISPL